MSVPQTQFPSLEAEAGLPVPGNESRVQYNVAIGYLRASVTALVVAHHAALAYHPFAPAPIASLIAEPRLWPAFPVVDAQRWSGFSLLVGFNDAFFMSLMFFLSGLFVWKSLERKGSVFHEISPTHKTLGRALKLEVSERTGARTDERPPTDGEGNANGEHRIRTKKVHPRIFATVIMERVSSGVENQRGSYTAAFLSDGMDQQEADDKHHRAGYAMNGERSRPRPARPQND